MPDSLRLKLFACEIGSGALERAHADLHATLASHEKHKADSRAALSAVEDQVLLHPGDNPGANRWILSSTPIQMLPPGGSIRGRWFEICPWVASRVDTAPRHHVWVVRVGEDDGELRPWHYIYVYDPPTFNTHIQGDFKRDVSRKTSRAKQLLHP